MRLRKLGYQRYEIAEGPAAGTVLERSSNPNALPCFRWRVVAGEYGRGSTDGFTLRGLASAVELVAAAAVLGRKGGAAGRGASKRRNVDYAALGRKGGRPGPSLTAQAAVAWAELASPAPAKMSLGPKLVEHMLDGESHLGLTPASAARLIRERAGKRTSAWITRDARVAGEP